MINDSCVKGTLLKQKMALYKPYINFCSASK